MTGRTRCVVYAIAMVIAVLFSASLNQPLIGYYIGQVISSAHAAQGSLQRVDELIKRGRAIYMYGEGLSATLAFGDSTEGGKATELNGQAAACSNCHQPSGFGSVEADIIALPTTGATLFCTTRARSLATQSRTHARSISPSGLRFAHFRPRDTNRHRYVR